MAHKNGRPLRFNESRDGKWRGTLVIRHRIGYDELVAAARYVMAYGNAPTRKTIEGAVRELLDERALQRLYFAAEAGAEVDDDEVRAAVRKAFPMVEEED